MDSLLTAGLLIVGIFLAFIFVCLAFIGTLVIRAFFKSMGWQEVKHIWSETWNKPRS